MCGISGELRFSGKASTDATAQALRVIAHRGPDGNGVDGFGPVVLGHNRLSIIDLSSNGRQPMANEDGCIQVTFNGEIYNHQKLRRPLQDAGHIFHSGTDTEVILHGYEQWGLDGLLARLRGMYAFALYDAHAEARKDSSPFLYLVRDRLGIKPLYYRASADRLLFSSEVRALREGPSEQVDVAAVLGFLALGSMPSPRTYLRDIKCLMPGSYLAVSRSGFRAVQYWNLDEQEGAQSQKDLPALLSETVSQHLLSDVPLGIFLSGGMDSAGLVAMAIPAHAGRILTLTVGFPEKEYSEADSAKAIAELLGTEHHEVPLHDDEFVAELPKILDAMDQPTADGVNTYFVSRAAKQIGLTVVLSGLGGDEVFLGYPHYRRLSHPLFKAYLRTPHLIRKVIRHVAAGYGEWRGQERFSRLQYLADRNINEAMYLLFRGFFAPDQVAELTGSDTAEVHRSLDECFAHLPGHDPDAAFDIKHLQRLEMQRYLHDQLLRDSDVFSMAHSLELRVPYLDHELVEAVGRIPVSEKLPNGINKPKLAEAVGHPLLRQLGKAPKQGFVFPFAHWMRRHAGILEEMALAGGPLRRAAVRRYWEAFRQGRLHWSRAWATVALAHRN